MTTGPYTAKFSWLLTYAGMKLRHHGEVQRCVFLIGQKRATTRELSVRTREGFMAWMALHIVMSPSMRIVTAYNQN